MMKTALLFLVVICIAQCWAAKVKLGEVPNIKGPGGGKARKVVGQIGDPNGKGAKLRLGKAKSDGGVDEDDSVGLAIQKCMEVDSNGDEVGVEDKKMGGGGPGKGMQEKRHSPDFENSQFQTGMAKQVNDSNGKRNTKTEMKKSFDCTNVTMEWLLAEEDTSVTQDGEVDDIKAGSAKLTIKLKGWCFCGREKNCTKNSTMGGNQQMTKEMGSGIKCLFKMTPRKGHAKLKRKARQNGKPEGFDLGSNSQVKFSNKFKADGTFKESNVTLMDDTTVAVTFPGMFTDELFYDPTLEPGDEETESAASTITASLLMGLIALVYTL